MATLRITEHDFAVLQARRRGEEPPPPPQKRNKYGAMKTPYNGHIYDSAEEARHAVSLDYDVAAGIVSSWQRQFPIEMRVNQKLICTYRADFYVLYPDGRYELHEVKGFETPEWKLKRKLLQALRPDLNVVIIKKGRRD